jgi:hypothetical protein
VVLFCFYYLLPLLPVTFAPRTLSPCSLLPAAHGGRRESRQQVGSVSPGSLPFVTGRYVPKCFLCNESRGFVGSLRRSRAKKAKREKEPSLSPPGPHFLFLESFAFRQGGHRVRLYSNRAPCSHVLYLGLVYFSGISTPEECGDV